MKLLFTGCRSCGSACHKRGRIPRGDGAYCIRENENWYKAFTFETFSKDNCLRIISVGFPAGVEALSYNLAQIVVTSLITGLGSEVLSARVYLQNIVNFVYLLGMSVGQGVQIIVGNNVGAGNYSGARSINRLGIKLALASNLILGLLMAVFRDNLLGIFTSDLKIIAIAAPIIISI